MQKSFITERASTSLNLRAVRNEKMIVRGFVIENETARSLDVLRVKSLNVLENVCCEVELYVVPVICSPICD